MFDSIPGLHSQGASSTLLPCVTIKNVYGLCKCPVEAKWPPGENHCPQQTKLSILKEQRVLKCDPMPVTPMCQGPSLNLQHDSKPWGNRNGCPSRSVPKPNNKKTFALNGRGLPRKTAGHMYRSYRVPCILGPTEEIWVALVIEAPISLSNCLIVWAVISMGDTSAHSSQNNQTHLHDSPWRVAIVIMIPACIWEAVKDSARTLSLAPPQLGPTSQVAHLELGPASVCLKTRWGTLQLEIVKVKTGRVIKAIQSTPYFYSELGRLMELIKAKQDWNTGQRRMGGFTAQNGPNGFTAISGKKVSKQTEASNQ